MHDKFDNWDSLLANDFLAIEKEEDCRRDGGIGRQDADADVASMSGLGLYEDAYRLGLEHCAGAENMLEQASSLSLERTAQDDGGSSAASAALITASTGKRVREKDLCAICWQEERDAVFVPCGHLVSCLGCARACRRTCPMCRKSVHKVQKVFRS